MTGILKILAAIVLRSEVENEWLLAGGGALSVLFGVILAALVGSDLPSLSPFIGVFVVVGLALIVFAFPSGTDSGIGRTSHHEPELLATLRSAIPRAQESKSLFGSNHLTLTGTLTWA